MKYPSVLRGFFLVVWGGIFCVDRGGDGGSEEEEGRETVADARSNRSDLSRDKQGS